MYRISFCFLLLGCGTFQKPQADRQDLEFQLNTFFDAPTKEGLLKIDRKIQTQSLLEDHFALSVGFEHALDSQMMAKAALAFQKDPQLTYQMLFLLAFDLPPHVAFLPMREAYIKYRKRHQPLALNDNLIQMLSGDSMVTQTAIVLESLESQWGQLTSGQKIRIVRGLADSHLDDSKFVARDFTSHDEFLRTKRKRISTLSKTNHQEIYSLFATTQLFKMQTPVINQLERFADNPSEKNLKDLRQICSQVNKNDDAPSLEDVDSRHYKDIELHLASGDITTARGLIMMLEKKCLKDPEKKGPIAWLGSTLSCQFPEILLEGLTLERPQASTTYNIVNYENGQKCGVKQNFIFHKIHLLSEVETQNPSEEDVLEDILSHFKIPRRRPQF